MDNRVVLVTGGTGSFGRAFMKEALRSSLKKIIVFSRDELKQYEMAQEFTDDRIRFFIGDVRDRDRLYHALDGVDIVVHAAALKQVPVAEYNPSEFIKTNILGTENVLMASIDRGVEKVLFLSTDKAAAPVTAYGSSKAMAEHLVRAGQSYSVNTKFATLRYGNVAGSRGSIIPLWRSLVKAGREYLPVTHEYMTRFFFTLENAVTAAVNVLDNMHGGDLFVPKMPSFRITDLAAALHKPYTVTGIRGAEKIAEVLVSADESLYFREEGQYFVRSKHCATGHLPAGFSYSSDNNTEWLTAEDLELILETL